MKQLIIVIAYLLFIETAYPQSKCIPPLPQPPKKTVGNRSLASITELQDNIRLAKLNISLDPDIAIVSIEKIRNGGSFNYSAMSGGKSFLYTGDNYASLLYAVKPSHLNKKQVYFDLKGFSRNDELTFKNSLEVHSKGEIEIVTWRREVYGTDLQDALLTRIGSVEKVSVSAITSERRAGIFFYKVVIEYFSRQRRNFIEFLSTSKEVVAEFVILIRSKLLMQKVTTYSSTADVLRSIKKDISRKFTINKDEMLTTFRTQEFEESIIVKVLYPINKIRYTIFSKSCLNVT